MATYGNEIEEGAEALSSNGVPCTICGKYLASYSSLCDHKRIHTGDRPHICQICNKRFTQKAHLMIHRRTHTGEKPYSCTICFKRFAQSSHLKNHKRIHTGEKAYLCQICNIGFNQKPRLEKHLATHFNSESHNNVLDDSSATPLGGATGQRDYNEGNFFEDKGEFGMANETKFTEANTLSFGKDVFIKEEVMSPLSNDAGVIGTIVEAETQKQTRKRKPMTVKHIHRSKESDIDDDLMDDLDYSSFLKPPDSVDNDVKPISDFASDSQSNSLMKTSLDITSLGGDDVLDDMIMRSNDNADGQVTSTENRAVNSGSDDVDRTSNASESNYSSDTGVTADNGPTIATQLTAMLHSRNLRSMSSPKVRLHSSSENTLNKTNMSGFIRTNNRICLVDFTTDDLLTHMMSRDDVHRCDFCCMIFQDQAMYHLHRSMHDKFDIRACNLCGKVARDKHDFIAHFLSEHK